MVTEQGRNGLLARTVLASQLRFYFGADPRWTRTTLLPLFDWKKAERRDLRAMWRTFLSYGRFDDGLLGAGLLGHYLEAMRHTDVLGDEAAARLRGHLASIALFSSIDPQSWLPTVVTDAPPAVRLEWARAVARSLRDLGPAESDDQWQRWIQAYWSGRVASVPRPFTPEEASATAV